MRKDRSFKIHKGGTLMLPAKIDSSILTSKDNRLEYVIDWFEQHLSSFYSLGRCYLQTEQQIEEAISDSIKTVYRKSTRYKGDLSFEAWVISIFIQACRELSSQDSLPDLEGSSDPLKGITQLKGPEKEAIALTYFMGISREEIATLLHIPIETLKELLFTGINMIRDGVYHGCKDFQKDYIDYLDRNMEREQKIAFEIHVYHCPNCQEDLASFQETQLTLSSLTGQQRIHLMDRVRGKILQWREQEERRTKKRNIGALAFVSFFAILLGTGYFTGTFSQLYYSWTEEIEELRPYLQHNLAERLDLEAESNGVRIKIKSAIADELQTIVYYEIEDLEDDNRYVMYLDDGVSIKNNFTMMDQNTYPRYYPSQLNTSDSDKNIYQGKMSLRAIKQEDGMIELSITRLQKIPSKPLDPTDPFAYEKLEYKTGEWNFEIPVTKIPKVEYGLAGETEVEGVKIRFEKLFITPTTTILQYGVSTEAAQNWVDYIEFANMVVNGKEVKVDPYSGGGYIHNYDMNWYSHQVLFDPLFDENPEQVSVQFSSARLSITDPATYIIDPSQGFPQVFPYGGGTFSIDKLEVGKPTEIVISSPNVSTRAFENLQFDIFGEVGDEIASTERHTEGMIIDKNGKEFDPQDSNLNYDELDSPRFIETLQTIRLHHSNPEEEVIPTRFEIYGYSTTKFLDDIVNVTVEN